MNEANLVGVHKAGVAHHVAAVRQIDGEHRSAAVGDGGRTMIMQLFVVVGADVAAREDVLKVLEEGRVHGHQVFELAVGGALFHHPYFAIAFDHLGLDFAQLVVLEDGDGKFAVEDALAEFGDALGAERVGGAGPAEGRLGLLVGLQQRLVGPLGGEGRFLIEAVHLFENHPAGASRDYGRFLDNLNSLAHISPYLLVDASGRNTPKATRRVYSRWKRKAAAFLSRASSRG